MVFRLVLLMSMGLGAMYMLHLLAQDYNKIRKPVAAAARALAGASGGFPRTRRSSSQLALNENGKNQNRININETLNESWKITSGAESESKEALLLLNFVKSHLSIAPKILAKAFHRGRDFRGMTFKCYDEYPFCFYSAKTMFRILKWFSDYELY